jgi:hypothetical protein
VVAVPRPIRVIFCDKVGPPTSVLNWYLENLRVTISHKLVKIWSSGTFEIAELLKNYKLSKNARKMTFSFIMS